MRGTVRTPAYAALPCAATAARCRPGRRDAGRWTGDHASKPKDARREEQQEENHREKNPREEGRRPQEADHAADGPAASATSRCARSTFCCTPPSPGTHRAAPFPPTHRTQHGNQAPARAPAFPYCWTCGHDSPPLRQKWTILRQESRRRFRHRVARWAGLWLAYQKLASRRVQRRV